MDTDRAGKILERHGLTKKAFADMMGVKPSTARMAFSLKRFSQEDGCEVGGVGERVG